MALERAVRSGRHPLASILLSEGRQARLAPPVLETLGPEVELYLAPQAVLDEVCGYPVHRGVLAYGPYPPLPSADRLLDPLGSRALVVCAVGVNDPENTGAIFRNAAAFGADAVLLDATSFDPLYRRSIRVSVGAALVTPFARLQAGEDLPALLQRHQLTPLALSPAGATPLGSLKPPARAAVLLGAEGPGLPDALLACSTPVRIPMAAGFDSLNVATALAVALHHLRGESSA